MSNTLAAIGKALVAIGPKVRGAIAVGCAFVLAQPDVTIPPLLKVALGATVAVLAYLGGDAGA